MIPLSLRCPNGSNHRSLWVRLARPDDRMQVLQVINRVGAECQYLYTQRYESNPTWEQLLERGLDIQQGLFLLIVEAGTEVVGFLRISRTGLEPAARATGDIGIVLLPQYRSLGIGTTLLGICIAAAPTLGFVELRADMLADNVIAQHLFSHFSFSLTTPTPAYLRYRQIWMDQVTGHLVLKGTLPHATYYSPYIG